MILDWLFGKKAHKRIEKLEKNVSGAFIRVRKDLQNIGKWIEYFHKKDKDKEFLLKNFNDRLSSVESEISEIKNLMSFLISGFSKRVSKHPKRVFDKQTAVQAVQTPVWTAVQTAFLRNLTPSERLVIWVLLNTNLKLSCEDIASTLGKDKSTIRGQINSIKQKNDFLIDEIIEKNGKKRFFISEKVKENLFKTLKIKMKMKKDQKNKKRKKKSEI